MRAATLYKVFMVSIALSLVPVLFLSEHVASPDSNNDSNSKNYPTAQKISKNVTLDLIYNVGKNYRSHPTLATKHEIDAVCNVEPGRGVEGPHGWTLMTEQVQLMNYSTAGNQVKLLCIVYSYQGREEQIQAIADTWGKKCDGFLVGSNTTQLDLGILNIPHDGEESYKNMWQKIRAMWKFVIDHYIDEFTHFHMCGDDTHVIVENLKAYLATLDNHHALYVGQRIPKKKYWFNAGGPGYTLNQQSLRAYASIYSQCHTGVVMSTEDRLLAECLIKVGVTVNNTINGNGQHLFHGEDPETLMAPPNMTKKRGLSVKKQYWGEYGFRYGMNATAPESVAFHWFKTAVDMKRHHSIIYRNTCGEGTLMGKALMSGVASQR